MSGETFEAHSTEEKLCITQYEQREYDACSWENEDFAGKRAGEESSHLGGRKEYSASQSTDIYNLSHRKFGFSS